MNPNQKLDETADVENSAMRLQTFNLESKTDCDENENHEIGWRCKKGDKKGDSWGEMKTRLLDVLTMQRSMREELRVLKDDKEKLRKSMNARFEAQTIDCKIYVDTELRMLESRVNGLAAVLDHVQKRCMEKEMRDETNTDNTEHESISSSESTDETKTTEENYREEKGIDLELIQEKRNRNWLRHNHLQLIESINPQQDLIIHRLAEDNILSPSDEEMILSHNTRKDQNRDLLLKIRRCSSVQFKRFLFHLETEHPHLACLPSVDGDTGESDIVQCIICDVKGNAQVDDVMDHIYQRGVLDGSTFESLFKMPPSSERWCRLLESLSVKADGMQVLAEALSKKYPGISQRLSVSRQTSFKCCCMKTKV